MKKIAFLLSILIFLTGALPVLAEYPEKPITIIVHSKPGSGIDITARQLALLARKYIKTPIVVENKTGGSGAIAMRYVLNKKADGYTILAVTKSFISTVLLTSNDISMDDFYFFAGMVIDPEVLITNRNSKVKTLEDIIRDAEEKNGKQRWLGPLVGGVDHLMAVKTWHKLNIRGEWIPYEGGADALAALMGKHGVVYVGNPVDVKGRPDLMIAAVAAKQKLKNFPNAPTFIEKGYDIEDNVLWRGFALKKGTDPKRIQVLEKLFYQISKDPEWIQFIENTSATPVFLKHEQFTEMVNRDQKEAIIYLKMAGILKDISQEKTSTVAKILWIFVLISALPLGILAYRRKWLRGEVVIAYILIAISLYLYAQTFNFPTGKLSRAAGPASMPRLLIYAMIFFSAWLIVDLIRHQSFVNVKSEKKGFIQALSLVGIMTGYLLVINYLGYFISTFIFLISGIYVMSYRRHWIVFLFAIGFLLLAYVAFIKVLQVPLPRGIIFE
ncbi:hypothetical protein B6D60_00260 [candidate division KSB1 bacterium 4484_87]|nr:MAG: hypothetical protein B6D60_00260 [candidate division KSB1 bacterium 4484_87]